MADPTRTIEDPSAEASIWRLRIGAFGRALLTAWSGVCLLTLILLIGGRWLRYTSWSATPGLDRALRELMVVEQQAFLWPWVYTSVARWNILLAVLLPVVCLHRRLLARLVTRVDGVWRLTPVTWALLLGGMVWVHYLFDLNPTVALVCAGTLGLAWLVPRVPFFWGGLLAYALVAAGDPIERLAILVWTVFLVATHRYVAPRVGTSELVLVRALAVIPMNLLAAMLPLVVPLHGGTLLGEGLAYSFCEVPNRGILFAAIPVCSSASTGYEECREGGLAEYDLASMKRVATHHFFSPAFYGRLELLVCLDEEIQVAVQGTVVQGRSVVQSVLSFPVDDPAKFVVLSTDKGVGTTIAYDEAHDAFFYSGEFDNPVVRYDRRTRRLDDAVSQEFRRPWLNPVSLEANNGSLAIHTTSIHPGRNRLYLADWMQGRYAYALDLSTLRVVARYDAGGGGSMGVAVDPERDRLYVSSMWGLEVFDLKTDALIARKRTGLGNRPVIVDAARNRLYVSSMVEGKIRILDRDTLKVVGQIPIGFGSRYAQLSLNGKYLFASSASAHYYWDADTLVRP